MQINKKSKWDQSQLMSTVQLGHSTINFSFYTYGGNFQKLASQAWNITLYQR